MEPIPDVMFRLKEKTASCCIHLGITGIIPTFEGENANIAKLAFIMMLMIFFLGLARIIFRRKDED